MYPDVSRCNVLYVLADWTPHPNIPSVPRHGLVRSSWICFKVSVLNSTHGLEFHEKSGGRPSSRHFNLPLSFWSEIIKPLEWISIMWNHQTKSLSTAMPAMHSGGQALLSLGHTILTTSEKPKRMVVTNWCNLGNAVPATSLNSSQHLNHTDSTALVHFVCTRVHPKSAEEHRSLFLQWLNAPNLPPQSGDRKLEGSHLEAQCAQCPAAQPLAVLEIHRAGHDCTVALYACCSAPALCLRRETTRVSPAMFERTACFAALIACKVANDRIWTCTNQPEPKAFKFCTKTDMICCFILALTAS